MVEIVGTYEHVSNTPDFEGYLRALGIPEDIVKKMAGGKPTLTISEADGLWTHHMVIGKIEVTVSYKFGETYNQRTPNNTLLTHLTRREGNKLITHTTTPNTKEIKIQEFSDAGFIMHWIHPESNSRSTSIFKRI